MVEVVQPDRWEVRDLKQLLAAVEESKEANKYLFIWDKQGMVARFMNYKAQLESLGPAILNMALGRKTKEEVSEIIRKAFIYGMRQGETLCYDIDRTTPNFKELDIEGTFDADLFFDYDKMTQEANFMPYVREHENCGIGGLNPGYGYCRSPDFGMVIRSGVDTAEEVQEQISHIPNFADNFMTIVIE